MTECEKCRKDNSTVRPIGTKHKHFLCHECRKKWSSFCRLHYKIFDKHTGTPKFHEVWEEFMQTFLSSSPEKVHFD